MNNKRNAFIRISDRIVNSMKPSLFIEYCYGIFRYRINGRSLTPIDLRMKIIAVIIVTLWISAVCIIGILPIVKVMLIETFLIENVIYILHWIIAGLHMVCTNLTVIFFNAEDNQRAMKIFADIDISLHASINDGFYKTLGSECKKLTMLYIIFCITLVTVTYTLEGSIDVSNVLFSFTYFEKKLEILLFCEMTFFLRHRMLLIKGYLTKFISGRNQRVSYACRKLINDTRRDKYFNLIGQVSDRNKKILDLASAFINAGEAFKIINDLYNFIILMTIFSAFVFILSVFWSGLNFLKTKNNGQVVVTLSTMVFWSIAELCSVVFISYYCEKVLKEREEIKIILKNIIIYDDLPKNMRKQAKVFIELTEIWPMTFHVFNMFQVNNKLVLKFISICTTYLIVVIQVFDLV
ncbi:uncharacterized protein [Battus philenor]|uniref:uncharacterized protein n=1 Tax=Battus philenor TaxID=42288 RepID=UPI0035D0595A